MIADDFYRQIIDIFARSPKERHLGMMKLHEQVVRDYIAAVQKVSEQDSIRSVSIGSDSRALAEIIAHIAESELVTADRSLAQSSPRFTDKHFVNAWF